MSLLHLLPDSERPRERLLRHGPEPLRDAELLALVLGTGALGEGALSTAQHLLARFASLRRMAVAGVAELSSVPGVGLAKACRVKAALAMAARLAARPFAPGESIGDARDVFARVGERLVPLEREVFLALSLDSKNRVLSEHQIAQGGVCSVEVLPRDLFAAILREAAAAVVFVHNHPSGDPEPSDADCALTERLIAAGRLCGVHVHDHLVVAQEGYYSFSDGKTTWR